MALDLTQRQLNKKTYSGKGVMLPPPPDFNNYGNQRLDSPIQPEVKPPSEIPVLDLTTSGRDLTEIKPPTKHDGPGKVSSSRGHTSNTVRVAPYPAHVSTQQKSPKIEVKQAHQPYQAISGYPPDRQPPHIQYELRNEVKPGYGCQPAGSHGILATERPETKPHHYLYEASERLTASQPQPPRPSYPCMELGSQPIGVAPLQHYPNHQQTPYNLLKMTVNPQDLNNPRSHNAQLQSQSPTYQMVSPTYKQHQRPAYQPHPAISQHIQPHSPREMHSSPGGSGRVAAGANTYGYHPHQSPYPEHAIPRPMTEKMSVQANTYPTLQKQHQMYVHGSQQPRHPSPQCPPGYYARPVYEPRPHQYPPTTNRFHPSNSYNRQQTMPPPTNAIPMMRMRAHFPRRETPTMQSKKEYEPVRNSSYSMKAASMTHPAILINCNGVKNDAEPKATPNKPKVVAKISAYQSCNTVTTSPITYKRISPKPPVDSPESQSQKKMKVGSPSSTWTPPVGKQLSTAERLLSEQKQTKDITPQHVNRERNPSFLKDKKDSETEAAVNLTFKRKERLASAPSLAYNLDPIKSESLKAQKPTPPKKSISVPDENRSKEQIDDFVAEAVKREVENAHKKRIEQDLRLKFMGSKAPTPTNKMEKLLKEEPLNLKRDLQVHDSPSAKQHRDSRTTTEKLDSNSAASKGIQAVGKTKIEPLPPQDRSMAVIIQPVVLTQTKLLESPNHDVEPLHETALKDEVEGMPTLDTAEAKREQLINSNKLPAESFESQHQNEVLDLSAKVTTPKEEETNIQISTIKKDIRSTTGDNSNTYTSFVIVEQEGRNSPEKLQRDEKTKPPLSTTEENRDILLEDQKFIVKLPVDPETTLQDTINAESERDTPDEELWGFDSAKTTPTDKDEEKGMMFELAKAPELQEVSRNDPSNSKHSDKLVIRLRRITVDTSETSIKRGSKCDESAKRDEAMRQLGLAKKS